MLITSDSATYLQMYNAKRNFCPSKPTYFWCGVREHDSDISQNIGQGARSSSWNIHYFMRTWSL